MTSPVPGVGGTLLPERYLATQLLDDAAIASDAALASATVRRLKRWWQHAISSCGPTSPLRVVFDEMAMPLFAILGFAAHDARFEGAVCRVRLATRRSTSVALLLAPWATRLPSRWVDLARHAHRIGAAWGIVMTPPFLSVVPTRGYALRRSIDLILPAAIDASPAHLLAVVHASRFDPSHTGPSPTVLDLVLTRAAVFQDHVRTDLQRGVEHSLGLLAPVIAAAERTLGPTGPLRPREPAFEEALTVVYRILFLLFAESRRLVPHDDPVYRDAYSISQFCREAAGGPALGLWDGLAATSRLCRLGCQTSGVDVTAFNGPLFARASAPVLEQQPRRQVRASRIGERDEAMRRTLVALGSRRTRAGLETLNYRDLGVEQLGAVYERVLDLEPQSSPSDPGQPRHSRHSQLRRQTGTFYTPQPLAEFLVRRTLAPLVEGADADRILELRVVDPAMGSGAFLVAACRYLASVYEDALVAEGRLSPEDIDDHERARMRRLIAERCLAGVDHNGTAVQLARLSLWLTTLAHGKPLGFLDHRLRTGNSLVGAWPDDLQRTAIRRSRAAPALPLFEAGGLDDDVYAAAMPVRAMLDRADDTVSDVRAKEKTWRHLLSACSPLHRWRVASHLWCARWFSEPGATPPDAAETRALIDAVTRGDGTLGTTHVERRLTEAGTIAASRAFFHWPLEFPDIFTARPGRRGRPGFDAVIGNPPWDMLRRDNGDEQADPRTLVKYVRQSGQYPSCVDGHLNLYQAFVDRSLSLVRTGGRVGLVLPWSVATDDGASALRERLLKETALDFVAGLDNAQGLFPIHRGLRFAVISATSGASTGHCHAAFGIRSGDQLDALPARGDGGASSVAFTPELLTRITGPARRIPDLRRPGDLDLLVSLNARFPRLGSPEGWNVSFGRELNATDAAPHFCDANEDGIPVAEGKHLAPFTIALTRARRVSHEALASMLDPGRIARPRLAYRDISGVGNRLTLIAAVIPAGVVTTHTLFCLRPPLDTVRQHFLCALLNSFVLNAVVRMLMGGHVTTTLALSLPAPPWRGDSLDRRIASLARRRADGRDGSTTVARLQALLAHRFELTGDEFAHVLDGCPLVPEYERAEALSHFDRGRRASGR